MKHEILKKKPNPTKFPIKPLYGLDREEAIAMSERVKWEITKAEWFMFTYMPKDKAMVARFIPPPLKYLADFPLVSAFVQQRNLNGGKGNDGLNCGYLEHMIAAVVDYQGQIGTFAIAIFIESDIGAMIGREMFGTPKKVGQIDFSFQNNYFKWKTKRRGITLCEAEGQVLDETIDASNLTQLLESKSYFIHQVISNERGHYYGYKPRFMSFKSGIRKIHRISPMDDLKFGFNESPFDPICLMEPNKIISATYFKWDIGIDDVNVIDEWEDDDMLPYVFAKFDPF